MGDTGSRPPQLRPGRALAHTPGASGSGSPHRSDSRSPQTPRGARRPDPDGRPGTTPPVPGWPTFLLGRLGFLGLPALVFALITWQVAAHGPLARADEHLSRTLVHPDRASEILADLGNVAVAVPVLAVVLGYVAWRARAAGRDRWWLPSLAAAALMAVVPALIVPLKELVARPGPPVMGPGTGFYPSGHTATAVIAYGGAALVLMPWLRSTGARRALLVGCLALNLGVAFGLIRQGYHWPLDVAAGWCLCAVLLRSLWLLLSRNSRRRSAGTPSSRSGPS
ncbi:phosphatase PAP2 family protein [Streptomyces sp. NPDC059837]|uniref:phosphatase PAP2 family protein n=1 Tax=Streptomyces sp. NPDC059837 TaxID=3346968 RepID=UPI00365982CE